MAVANQFDPELDKTYFESKGYFTLTHKDSQGKESELTLDSKKYDNLDAILDHIAEKIS